jgi:tetratricopeptide (TPR) repeat protein
MRPGSVLAAALAGGLLLMGGGCSKREERAVQERPASDAAPIDPSVMAFLSIARALHHEADMGESEGDAGAAIAPLERLVMMPSPRSAEADEVLADTRARLAEIRLRQGDLDRAALEVQAGLAGAREPNYFRGHLLEVAGLVEEARADALADAGARDEAARARMKARGLLEDAVRIQQHVIERTLPDGGSR